MTPPRLPLRTRALHAITWLIVFGSGAATLAAVVWVVRRWV